MSLLLILTVFTDGFQLSDFKLLPSLLAVAESLTNRSIAWPEWEQWKRVLLLQDYNTRVRTFPASFIAGFMGFGQRQYFQAEAGAEHAPKVKF